MKKILAMSLIAFTAVSTANAAVTSKAYVDNKFAEKAVVGTPDSGKTVVQMIKDVETAAGGDTSALDTRLTAAEGDIDNLESTVNSQTSGVAATYGIATGNQTAIATLNGDASTTGSVAKSVADAISAEVTRANAAYDATGSAAAAQAAAEATAAADATSKANAAKSEAITAAATAAAGLYQTLENKVTTVNAQSDDTHYPSAKAVYTAVSGASSSASAVDTKVGSLGDLSEGITNTSIVAAINDVASDAAADATSKANAAQAAAEATAASDATAKVNALANGAVATNTAAIASINNETTGILAQAKSYADGKDTAMDNRVDTLETTVASHTTAIGDANSGLTKGVADNAAAISAINDGTTGILATAEGYTNTKIGDLTATADSIKGTATGNVVTGVAQTSGAVSATFGNAVSGVSQGSGTGNVVTSVTLDANGQGITFDKGLTAMVDDYNTGTDGVSVLTKKTAGGVTTYAWEVITRDETSGN